MGWIHVAIIIVLGFLIALPIAGILIYRKSQEVVPEPQEFPTLPMTDDQIKLHLYNIKKKIQEKFNIDNYTMNCIYFSGGSLRSLLLGEEVKDYDLFCLNNETIELIKSKVLDKAFISDNAISFYIDGKQVQIITTVSGHSVDIISEFDFVMNQNFFDSGVLYFRDRDVIKRKELKINQNCRNKLGTLARISKFVERGYKAPNKTDLLSLGINLTKLDPVNTLTELKVTSKLYLTSDDCYTLMDNQSIKMGTDVEIRSLNGNRGSGL